MHGQNVIHDERKRAFIHMHAQGLIKHNFNHELARRINLVLVPSLEQNSLKRNFVNSFQVKFFIMIECFLLDSTVLFSIQ